MELEDLLEIMEYGMGGGYGYGYGGYAAFLAGLATFLTFVAVIGGIVLRATVFSEKNQGKYTGFMGWLYNFMNFRSLIVQPVLKLLYCITACIITTSSFVTLISGGMGIITGILGFIVGQIVARLIYELLMLTILLVTNVMEINKKLGGKSAGAVDLAPQADMTQIASRMQAAKQAYQAARATAEEAKTQEPKEQEPKE